MREWLVIIQVTDPTVLRCCYGRLSAGSEYKVMSGKLYSETESLKNWEMWCILVLVFGICYAMIYSFLLVTCTVSQNCIIWYKSTSPWLLQLRDFMSCNGKVGEYNLLEITIEFLVVIAATMHPCALSEPHHPSRSKMLLPIHCASIHVSPQKIF